LLESCTPLRKSKIKASRITASRRGVMATNVVRPA
jgi:hypothetical protein